MIATLKWCDTELPIHLSQTRRLPPHVISTAPALVGRLLWPVFTKEELTRQLLPKCAWLRYAKEISSHSSRTRRRVSHFLPRHHHTVVCTRYFYRVSASHKPGGGQGGEDLREFLKGRKSQNNYLTVGR